MKCYATIRDWRIFDIYIDEGISGKNICDRPELLRLLSDVRDKRVSNVLVYKIDRLTRSTKDLIDLVELFNKYNCSFNSLNESIDTKSSTGRMFIKIIGIFAEFERENIIERVKLGLERKVREGFTIASKNISYGYRKPKGKKIQVIDMREAEIVNEVYDLFIEGYSYTAIANFLNSQNIKTKNNNKWSYKTIKLLLTNPTYIGKVRYGINTSKYFEINGKHDSIIDVEKYNLVQSKIKDSRKNSSIFYNKVFCSCGKRLSLKKCVYVSTNKNVETVYYRYICGNPLCLFKGISERKLEKLFANYISLWFSYSFIEKVSYVSNYIKFIVVANKNIKEIIYITDKKTN